MSDADTPLKPYELLLLSLAASGFTNSEIAKKTSYSPGVVENMLGGSHPTLAIYRKIGVRNRASAIRWFLLRYGETSLEWRGDAATQPELAAARAAEEAAGAGAGATVDKPSSRLLVEIATSPYYPQEMNRLRTRGYPTKATHYALSVTKQLEQIAHTLIGTAASTSILGTLLLVYADQGIAYRETLPRTRIRKLTGPITKRIREIAKECSDEQMNTIADFAEADTSHTTGDYTASIHLHRKVRDRVQVVSLWVQSHRQIILGLAHQGEAEAFDEEVLNTRQRLKDGRFSEDAECSLLEGIAGGETLLGRYEQAADTIGEAEASLDKSGGVSGGKINPMRVVQLTRTKLRHLLRSSPDDKDDVTRLRARITGLEKERDSRRYISEAYRLLSHRAD